MPTSSPPFINLEFFFNLIYRFILFLFNWIISLLGGSFNLYWIKFFLLALSAFFVLAIGFLVYRLSVIRREERGIFLDSIKSNGIEKTGQRERWEKIEISIASENPADWKQAIIDADIMLDEMVKAMNYPGETLGERLKAIESSDFTTLQDAWEAHRVRNQIAHESDFVLNHREAKIAIERFKRVFDEFSYI